MDYEKIIHALIDPIVENKDIIMIRELPSDSPREVVLLIVAENEDTARLIGRKGSIANALRELLAVAGKTENKRIHLKFESFEEKNED
ncbi:MAG: KH domain-containing protein [Methanomicrobia archaeon]|nr:KH domain-containing protein [Methanomicrobia archaeon]